MWWHRIAMGWFKTAWKQRQTISSCQVVKYCLVKRQALRWKDVYWTLQMVLRSQPKAISKQSFADGSPEQTNDYKMKRPTSQYATIEVTSVATLHALHTSVSRVRVIDLAKLRWWSYWTTLRKALSQEQWPTESNSKLSKGGCHSRFCVNVQRNMLIWLKHKE